MLRGDNVNINHHIRALPDFDNWVSAYIEAWDRQAARKEKEMGIRLRVEPCGTLDGRVLSLASLVDEDTGKVVVKNAKRLIAAAPDLLAALSLFVEQYDPDCGWCPMGPNKTDVYDNARATIAKAKGE